MYPELRLFIRTLAQKARLDPSLYSCHSARRGGATFASEFGATDVHVKLQGMWKSEAYLCYLRSSLDSRWSLLGWWPTPPVVTPSYTEGLFYWVFRFVLSASVHYWFSALALVFLL
jgi:hypothetical protein